MAFSAIKVYGTSGFSGYSGLGLSGYSGYSGPSGFSGYSGLSGFSGYSGVGVSGFSGYSGYSGIGVSGFSGYSGTGGNGFSGYSGYAAPSYTTFVLAVGVDITTGTNKTNIALIPNDCTITKCFAVAKVGPVGADLILDININGVSIWNSTPSNRIKILDGQTSGTQILFDTTSLLEGDSLTVDVDQIGSSVAGQDITVVLRR